MRKLLCAIVMTAACAEVADKTPPSVPSQDDNSDPEIAEVTSMCQMIIDDGSACAHACDPAALEAFMPPGTCAIFDCPLSDGTSIRVGGCRH